MRRIDKLLAVIVIFTIVMMMSSACGKNSQSEDSHPAATADGQDDNHAQSTQDMEKHTDPDLSDYKGEGNEEDAKTSAEFTEADAREYNVAVLNGPTAIGFVKAWDDSDNGETLNQYNVTSYGAAVEITAGLVKGDIDIAAIPCNLASVLYNKTEGKLKVAAINTLGVLYMISTSEEIHSVADLKGKTIYTTGQGTTPQYTLNYILEKNGLKPDEDVKLEYKSEAAEVAAAMSEAEDAIAMLPQPYVTTVLMQNENMKIVLDMTEEWNKVSDEPLITGVVVARTEAIEENEKAFRQFLKDYEASAGYANENVVDTAQLIEAHNIFKAAAAKQAIPYCNICFIIGEDMEEAINSYLNVLYEANPQSVGGEVPDKEFYYKE